MKEAGDAVVVSAVFSWFAFAFLKLTDQLSLRFQGFPPLLTMFFEWFGSLFA